MNEADALEIVSEMNTGGTIFGDGVEDDRIEFCWGCRATLRPSATKLHLVRSA